MSDKSVSFSMRRLKRHQNSGHMSGFPLKDGRSMRILLFCWVVSRGIAGIDDCAGENSVGGTGRV